MSDLIQRVRKYAGKTRNQVRSAHITARDTIEIANHIVRIESEYSALRAACEDLVQTAADHSSESIGSLAIIDAIDSIERLIK